MVFLEAGYSYPADQEHSGQGFDDGPAGGGEDEERSFGLGCGPEYGNNCTPARDSDEPGQYWGLRDLLPKNIQNKLFLMDISYQGTVCWGYNARLNRNGYKRCSYKGRESVAHRVLYSILVCDIINNHVIDHLCRNRQCCNPSHMECVSHSENTRRGQANLYIRKDMT